MDSFDVVAAAQRLNKQNQLEAAQLDERRRRAQKAGRNAAQRIGSQLEEVRRIWGFGSTYETWRNYRFDSDIDLAIEGGDWLAASPIADEVDCNISIIELAKVKPDFRALVEKNGVLLYEKS